MIKINRYNTICPHQSVKCPHMDDVTDRCKWDNDCLRDEVIKKVKEIDKKRKWF